MILLDILIITIVDGLFTSQATIDYLFIPCNKRTIKIIKKDKILDSYKIML